MKKAHSALRAVALVLALGAAALAQAGVGAAAAPQAPLERAPDFELEVLPLLTRIGCNSGQCHGAAGGQAGFALSLRGYDPDADFDAIVRERGERRVDRGNPRASLLLRKASMEIRHKGGRKLPKDSEEYETVLRWIEAGAARHAGAPVSVQALDVEPKFTLGAVGENVQLTVKARCSDGTVRDVTSLALYTSNDDAMAPVDRSGKITLSKAGETAVLVKLLGSIGSARVAVPFGRKREPAPAANPIDAAVESKLAAMGIPPSPPCDDFTFLRRASLDLAGRLPEPAEVAAFAADASAGKRAAKVDELLKSPEAVSHWTRWLADLCRVRSETMTPDGAAALHAYLRDAVARRMPLDQLVRSLVTAVGEPWARGPAAFVLAVRGPKEQMEFVTRTFLGVRFQCAQCHQHPFDRWSRSDYFGAASFFARVRIDKGRVVTSEFGEFTDPKTGGAAKAQFPGGGAAEFATGQDRRQAFAEWMLDPASQRFDRAMANRLWQALTGRGLVEPVDDLREANPPTNPELLDLLASMLRDSGRDWLGLVATIAQSAAYERSTAAVPGNEADEVYGSRGRLRALPAAVLVDALATATGVRTEVPQAPRAARAADIPDEDGGSYTLTVLGRCPRDGTADPSRLPSPTVPAALHWLHGPYAGSALGAAGTRIAAMLARRPTVDAAIDELFAATWSRAPRDDERAAARRALGTSVDREKLEDLLWTLIASNEFTLNH